MHPRLNILQTLRENKITSRNMFKRTELYNDRQRRKCKRKSETLILNKAKSISSTPKWKLHEVFLGGSCKPTTWRTDTAIPILDKHKVTYYNPQVQEWVPELIKQENIAKQNAEVMFFVIDKQTRSVASIIEVAYIAGTRRKLTVVIHELKDTALKVMGESISDREFKDLQNGRQCLKQLVEYHGKKVFHDIKPALKNTITIVQSGYQSSPLSKKRKPPFPDHHNKSNFNLKSLNVQRSLGLPSRKRSNISMFLRQKKVDSNNTKSQLEVISYHKTSEYDVYVAGSEKASSWHSFALPFLQNKELKCKCSSIKDEWNENMFAVKMEEIKSCRVMLFVITNNVRGMLEMTIAAHCIGMKMNVVLCVQKLEPDTVIDGEKLSCQAVRDYNRGRVYLSDLASQRQVPVYDNISEAVQCVVDKCSRTTSNRTPKL